MGKYEPKHVRWGAHNHGILTIIQNSPKIFWQIDLSHARFFIPSVHNVISQCPLENSGPGRSLARGQGCPERRTSSITLAGSQISHIASNAEKCSPAYHTRGIPRREIFPRQRSDQNARTAGIYARIAWSWKPKPRYWQSQGIRRFF